MNDLIKKLKVLESDSLSDMERGVLREKIVSFMAEHPIVQRKSFASYFYISGRHKRRVAYAAMTMFLLSAGISYASYAAESALPGDKLYSVKVHVNEKVVGALHVGSEAKADFARKEIERRAEEAEKLEEKDGLSESVKTTLAREATLHIEEFSKAHVELSKKGDGKKAEATKEKMKKSLKKHEATLLNLGVSYDLDDRKQEKDEKGERSEPQKEQKGSGKNADEVESKPENIPEENRDEDVRMEIPRQNIDEVIEEDEKDESEVKIEVPRVRLNDVNKIEL